MGRKQPFIIVEQICNSIFHGLAALGTIGIAVYLSIYFIQEKSVLRITGLSIFLTTLFFMYLMSTLYHSLIFTRARKVFLVLDYSAIFLFIAGTYTAFIAILLPNLVGLLFLIAIWTIVITGITLRAIFHNNESFIFIVVFLLLGWLALLLVKFVWESLTAQVVFLLLFGGISYSVGVLFVSMRNKPFMHSVWHLCVIAGTVFHFIALLAL